MNENTTITADLREVVSPLLTYAEAATYLRKGTTFVRELVYNGELGIKRIGRTPYIHRDELDRYITTTPTVTGKQAKRARYNRSACNQKSGAA